MLSIKIRSSFLCLIVSAVLSLAIMAPPQAVAAPALNFSDLASGPKTGNTDDAAAPDHGAIVTIWGNNLGSVQGASKVYVGTVEATKIYYWKNADGKSPGGPADLEKYHHMQEIAFAIPGAAPDGPTTITVVVNGRASNPLPFAVRPGRVLFVTPGGNDSTGNGSWTKPWKTLAYVFNGGNGKLMAGDTVYSVGVGSTAGLNVGAGGAIKGTADSPVSLVAYPGTSVSLSGKSYTGYVVFNYYYTNATRMSEYINISKVSITAAGDGDASSSGICVFKGNRIVGIEITGPTVYGGYGGAITGNNAGAGGGKYYGIYIHNYGTDNHVAYVEGKGTSPSNCPYTEATCKSSYDIFQHLYYISNRSTVPIEAYEIGWNHLTDNPIFQGIHIYDMGTTAGWTGRLSVHHNVVKNQRGMSINVSYPGTTPLDIYNNVLISDANDVYNYRAFQILGGGSVRVFNNTVHGYAASAVLRPAHLEFRNNLLIDTKGQPYIYDTLTNQSNNLFFSTGATVPPAWAAGNGNISKDPKFKDQAVYNFSLLDDSPALSKGFDTTATVPVDFLGQPRGTGNVSIGAFERSSMGTPQWK